jgi:hypothetical protein
MTLLNIAFPVQSALPVAQMAVTTVVGNARSLLGMGIAATSLVVFKPLLSGMLRAALLVLSPRQSKDEQLASRNLRNILAIKRAANDYDSPSMNAELQALAARG